MRLTFWSVLLMVALVSPVLAAGGQAGAAGPAAGADWAAYVSPTCGLVQVAGGAFAPAKGGDGETGLRFMAANAKVLGLLPGAANVRLLHATSGKGARQLCYRRLFEGQAVLTSFVTVHLDAAGRVVLGQASPEDRLKSYPVGFRLSPEQARVVAEGVALSGHAPTESQVAETGVFPVDGQAVPAYAVRCSGTSPLSAYEAIVSAADGAVLRVTDLLLAASGRVFSPNPVVTLQNFTLVDDSDAASAVPVQAYRTLDFETDSSVYLRGAYADVVSSSDTDRATNAARVFAYDRHDKGFEETNVYYHLDMARRAIQTLGVSLDGLARQKAYAHFDDPAYTSPNAFYSSVTRGLYFLDHGVDAGEDCDVIMHEFGHAVLDFLVPALLSGTYGRSLHEGFADLLAAGVSSRLSLPDTRLDPDPASIAEWFAKGLPAAYLEDGGKTLRRIDDKESYKTFRDLNSDPYNNGEIWSRYWWEVRQGYVDLGSGAAVPGLGNDTYLSLVMKTHSILNPSTDLPGAARTAVQADVLAFGGVHTRQLVQAGIKRGLMNVAVSSISPSFLLLGTTAVVDLSGEAFSGANGVFLSDGTALSFTTVNNSKLRVTVPALERSGRFAAVVANMGTTSPQTGAFFTVDDHPNTSLGVTTSTLPARDTLLVNASPAPGNIEVTTVPQTREKEVDFFRFTGIRGHTYTIQTGAGTARDTVLTVYPPEGEPLVNDDRPDSAERTSMVTVAVSSSLASLTTTYYARVELQTGQKGTYTVSVLDPDAPDDHPNDPAGARDPADKLTVDGQSASGTIEYPGDADCFRFDALPGAVYDISTTLGNLTDSYLSLYSSADTTRPVDSNDDNPDAIGDRSSHIDYFQPATKGVCMLQVRHFDVLSLSATGSYGVAVTRRSRALDVQKVEIPVAIASKGQSIPVTVTVANSGTTNVVGLSTAFSITSGGRSRSSDFLAVQPAPGNPTSLVAGKSAVLRYTLTSKATALSGSFQLDAAVSGTQSGGTAVISDPGSAITTAFTLRSPALLSIYSVSISRDRVSRGQSAMVTVSVDNFGQATAAVTLVRPLFLAGSTNRAAQYTVTPSPALPGENPDSLGGGQRGIYRFQVDVHPDATLGPLTLQARVTGTDVSSGLAVPVDETAVVPASWTVQIPARLGLLPPIQGPGRWVTGGVAAGWRVSSDRTAGVTLSVRNDGQAELTFSGAAFQFRGSTGNDRSLEFAVTPAPNPLTLAGGTAGLLRYFVLPSAEATTGPVSVTVALSAIDSNSRSPLTTTGQGIYSTFVLERPAGLNLVRVERSQALVSRGQTALVTATVENGGQATALGLTAALLFSRGSANAGPDFAVTALQGNPVNLAGGTRGLFRFSVGVGSSATTGPVEFRPVIRGLDVNAGDVLETPAALTVSWTVQRPAALSVTGLSLRPATVSRSGSFVLTVAVANSGEASARIDSMSPQFIGPGGSIRSGDYSLMAAGPNPSVIAGGARVSLVYNVLAQPQALAGTIQAAPIFTVRDVNSGAIASVLTPVALRPSFRLGYLSAQVTSPLVSDLLFADEPIRFAAVVKEDTGATVPGGGLVWTADGSTRLGTGATLDAVLPAGSHNVVLTAATATGLATSVRLRLDVLGQQQPVNLLVVAGTLKTGTGSAVGAGHTVLVQNLSRGVSGSAVTGADGRFQLVLSADPGPAAVQGDLLGVSARDAQGLLRVVSPAQLTVRARDLLAARRTQDLVLAGLSSIQLRLNAGLNLVSLPARPASSGTAYDTRALLRDTGASFLVRVAPVGGAGRMILELPGTSDTGAPVSAVEGYLLSSPGARTVTLLGNPWNSSEKTRQLVGGLNFVGVPGSLPLPVGCDLLATPATSSLVVRTRTGTSLRGEFQAWVPGTPPYPLEPGKGYLVVPREPGRVLVLPGE